MCRGGCEEASFTFFGMAALAVFRVRSEKSACDPCSVQRRARASLLEMERQLYSTGHGVTRAGGVTFAPKTRR